jgi:mitotic spindle assembly checkpoint protein MAD1
MAHASLERQLVAAQTAKMELEVKLRERDATIERLESDRRLLAQQEKEERQEKEREQAERQQEKVRSWLSWFATGFMLGSKFVETTRRGTSRA